MGLNKTSQPTLRCSSEKYRRWIPSVLHSSTPLCLGTQAGLFPVFSIGFFPLIPGMATLSSGENEPLEVQESRPEWLYIFLFFF